MPLFLSIISLCLDALSPTLFQFAYPLKIEAFFLVSQVLINSIFVAFISSKILQRSVFRFENRQSERAKSGECEGWGRTSKLHLVVAAKQLERCGLVHYLARAQHLESNFLFFSSKSPDAQFFCIMCTIYQPTRYFTMIMP